MYIKSLLDLELFSFVIENHSNTMYIDCCQQEGQSTRQGETITLLKQNVSGYAFANQSD